MGELQVGERGLDPVVFPPSISSIIISSSPKYLRELTTLTHEGAASRQMWIGYGCASPFIISSSANNLCELSTHAGELECGLASIVLAPSLSPFDYHFFFCKHVCELSTRTQVGERGLTMVVLAPSIFLSSSQNTRM
jgi:hypothetical protein